MIIYIRTVWGINLNKININTIQIDNRLRMKKIALVLGMAGVMTLLAACSDDKAEIAEYKASFVSDCVKASGSPAGETAEAISAICGCAYDKTIEKYGLKEFKRIEGELAKSATAEPDFQKSMIEFVNQCTKNDR